MIYCEMSVLFSLPFDPVTVVFGLDLYILFYSDVLTTLKSNFKHLMTFSILFLLLIWLLIA